MKRFPFFLAWLLVLIGATACQELFEYHPNQIILDRDERNLTDRYLRVIQNQTPKDTLRLIVMGDTQRFYDQTQDFVDKANSLSDIDFVVHQGDISDFGLAQEFQWVHDIMKDLKWPYLTVIGNHDLLGNARLAYQKMFGPLNYSFVYGHTKFVFLDTNSREYSFDGTVPNLNWLKTQITPAPTDTWQQAVIVSHIPPFDSDFDPQLKLPFHQVLSDSKRVALSLHGHKHSWQTEPVADNSILYHVTTTVKKRGFSLVKIWADGFEIERMEY